MLFFLLQLLLQSKHKKAFQRKRTKREIYEKTQLKVSEEKLLVEWTQQNHFWFLTLVKLVEAENVRFKDKNVISEIRTDFVYQVTYT